jgi:hypothetical protein
MPEAITEDELRAVWSRLEDSHYETGPEWFTVTQLAEKLKLGRDRVKRIVNKRVAEGVLEKSVTRYLDSSERPQVAPCYREVKAAK